MATGAGDTPGGEGVPITIAVAGIARIGVADPTDHDEPYVLVVAIDLTTAPQPIVRATRYGPWGDLEATPLAGVHTIPPDLSPAAVDALANFAVLRRPFWGLDNRTARPIERPEDVIILVAPVGRDEDSTGAMREHAQATIVAALAESFGSARAVCVGRLIAALNGALGLETSGPESDEPCGARELALTPADLQQPRFGPHSRPLTIGNGSGRYRIDFAFLRG